MNKRFILSVALFLFILTSLFTGCDKINSSPWNLSIDGNEILSTKKLKESYLIYSVKNDDKSIVYKKNLKDGSQTMLIEFIENVKADTSGNYWTGLGPSASLSPDKQTLAFIDKEGLKVYNIQNKKIDTFIRLLEASPADSEDPPKWSVASLNSAYQLALPLWSPDGKYISFQEVEYEGSCIGMVRSDSGAFIEDISYAVISDFKWSPADNSYIIASYNGDIGPDGLFISLHDNVTEIANLVVENIELARYVYADACFSPDGKYITFVSFSYESDATRLSIMDTYGNELNLLTVGTDINNPFFDDHGEFVYYFQKKNDKQTLSQYDIKKKQIKDLIIFPSDFYYCNKVQWTKEEYLYLSFESTPYYMSDQEITTRMLILDLKKRQVVYASPIFNQFTIFDTLVK